jgi:hypothetical protein
LGKIDFIFMADKYLFTMNSLVTGFTQKIKPGTKILFANFPADGHFNPLTTLAMQLKQSGCDIRWYTSSYYSDKLAKT